MAADEAHEAADAEIEAFRREVAGIYAEAQKTASQTLTEYLELFREEDDAWRDRVARGETTEAQWKAWRRGKILTGRRYRVVLKQVAEGYTHANEAAMDALDGRLPGVYAENYNYGTFQAYSAARVDDAFALQDASTVQRLLTDHDSYLPKPTVNAPKDVAWNRRLLANQITQGVLLGESMPKIAKRVGKVTGSNMATAMRTARTSVTAAENAGRVDSYRRAQSLGIELEQEWLATMDGRTRHTHRQLDGERVKVGGKFENGCRYPGDPEAPYAETANCRCTLIAAVEGVDYSDGKRWSRLPDGMTYENWKAGKDLDDAERKEGGNGKAGKKGEVGAGSKRKADGKEEAPHVSPSHVIATHDTASAAAEALRASLSRGEALSAKAVRAVVGKMVPLGPADGGSVADYLDISDLPAHNARMFERAARYVPTSMLDIIRAGGVKVVRAISLERAEFDPTTNAIRITRKTDELVAVHEMMHAVEEHDPAFLEAERRYFESRTRGKARKRLEDITGDTSYDDLELAYDVGSCIDPYAFKDYGGDGYELMSMGVETLYRSPSSYLKDPDMLKWVLTMIGRFG